MIKIYEMIFGLVKNIKFWKLLLIHFNQQINKQ